MFENPTPKKEDGPELTGSNRELKIDPKTGEVQTPEEYKDTLEHKRDQA